MRIIDTNWNCQNRWWYIVLGAWTSSSASSVQFERRCKSGGKNWCVMRPRPPALPAIRNVIFKLFLGVDTQKDRDWSASVLACNRPRSGERQPGRSRSSPLLSFVENFTGSGGGHRAGFEHDLPVDDHE